MSAAESPERAAGGPTAVSTRSRSRPMAVEALAIAMSAVLILVTVAVTYFVVHERGRDRQQASSAPRTSGIPSTVSTPLAYAMGLAPLPADVAPSLTLVDQHGQRMSLASLKGHAVVLEFIDPHCVDICPIMSQEVVQAYHDLGPQAAKVIFIGVNVNPYFVDVRSMAAYSDLHGLNTVPTWHFLTGSVSSLRAVWRAYHVSVNAPDPSVDVVHTSVAYFIDPSGRERYIAFPTVDHTSKGDAYLPAGPLASWAKGIALVAQSMS